MDRPNVIRLPADTAWLNDVNAQNVCAAISVEGGHIYFVGGCVRDAVLRLAGSDIDLATDVPPQEVMRLAEAAGLKAVATGIDHGTITVVSGGTGYEVTTFRRDVTTDGRRAEVAFSTDIAEDARRRDFTLNALYASPDGIVHDPLDGIEDCRNRRIRFIEDASMRIQEDYLRILRYFRFHAWYALADAGFDTEALGAITENSSKLETLSAERIGAEMVKLLRAPDPSRAVAAMRQTGCLLHVLPGSDDRLLGPTVHLEQSVREKCDPMLRLAALGGENVPARLRLSRAMARKLQALVDGGYGGMPLAELAYRQGQDIALGAAIIRAALAETPLRPEDLKTIENAAEARFPLKAADLMPRFEGKALGDALAAQESRWIASGFALTREELMTEI